MRPTAPAFLALGVALAVSRLCAAAAPQAPTAGPLASRVNAVTDAVLAHHVEAPTRQQMIHSGIVGMYRAVGKPVPPGLGRKVSGLTTPEQFAALLADVRPRPSGGAATEGALDDAFLEGLSNGVPGGVLLMKAKDRKVAEQMAGNRYVGIQVAVSLNDRTRLPEIAEALKGGPADHAGMKKGDIIEAVDGVDLGGGTLAQYIDRLRGAEGTEVTVRARRPEAKEPLTFRMTRGVLPHVTASGLGEGGRLRLDGPDPIGYVKISEILSSTPRELRELAGRAESEGLKAVVLDLRGLGQGQGDLHSAVLLADELLDGGTIGRVRLADREVTYAAESGALFRDWPMAVLVDGQTVSHSEWLAAALQDTKRATVVGSLTAGQGATRSTVPVGDGSWSASIVTGLLERGDGRPIGHFFRSNGFLDVLPRGGPPRPEKSHFGVTPDVAAPPAPAVKGDPALTAAVGVLRKALAAPGAPKVGARDATAAPPSPVARTP